MTASGNTRTLGGWRDGMRVVLRDAAIAASVSIAVGLLVHLLRPDGIPLVADQEYDLFVPCPESGGEVTALAADDPAILAEDSFVIDARSKEDFDAWRLPRSINIPYDYLDPTPRETLEDLAGTIARSRSKRVVVYGDGDAPDTGEQLAKEVSGSGIKQVFFVRGGAPELKPSRDPGDQR
jgi:hypothetical protein